MRIYFYLIFDAYRIGVRKVAYSELQLYYNISYLLAYKRTDSPRLHQKATFRTKVAFLLSPEKDSKKPD